MVMKERTQTEQKRGDAEVRKKGIRRNTDSKWGIK